MVTEWVTEWVSDWVSEKGTTREDIASKNGDVYKKLELYILRNDWAMAMSSLEKEI